MRPAALLALPLLALPLASLACRQTPAEHAAPAAPAAAPAAAPPPRYRPALEDSARRITLAVADGGAPTPALSPTRLELAVPDAVDVVAARVDTRWVVAALERDRVTFGLAAAERVYALWSEAHHAPTAPEFARVVGALYYYPRHVHDGTGWSHTADAATPGAPATVPALVPRPNAMGRSLLFSFWIPEGSPGAGAHIANIHVTDSGLLIDDAPAPERR